MSDNDRIIPGNEREVSLHGIFGIDTLELLTSKLSKATEFSFTVIDYRGQNITDGIVINPYCKQYKNNRECMECQMTAAFAAAKAAIKCCPYYFTCPVGLCSIAVPIIVNEQYLGALVGGRVRCLEEENGLSDEDPYNKLRTDALFQEVPVFPREKIEAIGDLMFLMLKEIGEKETYNLKLISRTQNESRINEIISWNDSLQAELKQSKLKHLRSQIHPQFLLNMFTTAANFAVLEDAHKTEEILVDFSSLIRYYLDESRELIMIEEEMKQVEKYLSTLRSKYEGKFNYHLKINESMRAVKFPVLVIFPLIGYVINYGVFPVSFKGTLYLDVEQKGDQGLITMQMENQNRSDLSYLPMPGFIMDEKLIREQLDNTRKRLSYVYGESAVLDLKPDMVSLLFPRKINNTEVKG